VSSTRSSASSSTETRGGGSLLSYCSGYVKGSSLYLKRKRVNKIVPPHVLMAQFFIERRNWLFGIAKLESYECAAAILPSRFLFYPPHRLSRSFLSLRLVPPGGRLTSKAVPSLSLAFSLEARRRSVSALIGLLVGRLRSCGINSPARFTSLWLYSRCRNRARTDIPCCAAHSALSERRKVRCADRSVDRGWRRRAMLLADCLMRPEGQEPNVSRDC